MEVKKKIIALCTAAVMMISFVAGASAALRGDGCEDEAALLSALGIISENAVSSFNPTDFVTRQEFGEYVLKALGETDESVAGYSEKFTDFTATGYIAKGVASGFISGYPDGSFKPGQNITTAEAEKMIIDAVGYSYLAEQKGDYPDSYVSTASEIGLSKNVSKGTYAEINVRDAVYLIYNMLNLPIPLVSPDGREIVFDPDRTVMSEKFDILKGEGIVTANEYSSLVSPEGVTKGGVMIGDYEYYAGISGVENYLGYYVDFYYMDDNGEYTVVYSDPVKKSKDLRIYAKEISRFENGRYYYFDSESSARESSAAVSPAADVIYNGKAMPEIDDSGVYVPEFGYVTLIDNNRDGKYEVISIVERNILVLNMYDDNEFAFYDKYDSENIVYIDPEDSKNEIRVTTSQGIEITLDEVEEWDVLEIAQSADGKLTDIVVHRETVSGMIKSLGRDEFERQVITIDSKEYPVSEKLTDYNNSKGTPFAMSQTYNFILNSDGVIVGYNSNVTLSSDGSYGYMISKIEDETDDTFFYIKIFTADNQMKTFKTVQKPRIDGSSSKTSREAFDKLPINPSVIYYKTDANGYIKEIDTITRGENESVNSLMVKGTANYKYSSSKRTIGGKINFNDQSLVFIVPTKIEGASEREFEVKPAVEHFRHYADYNVTGYARDVVSPFTDVVVLQESVEAAIKSQDEIYLVQRISSGLNEDDEEVAVIELVNGSGTKELNTENYSVLLNAKAMDKGTTVGVQAGDVIMFAQNKTGAINNINVIYRPTTDTFYPNNNPNAGADYLAALRVGLWKVFYKSDNYLRVVSSDLDLTDDTIVGSINSGQTPVENVETANVFVYEPDEKLPYRQGSVGEIRDYYSSKMASKVLIRTNDANTRIIVIYK